LPIHLTALDVDDDASVRDGFLKAVEQHGPIDVQFGIGDMEVRRLEPAMDTMPSLAELPNAFRVAFFGGLDYAIIGKKI
ncbi:MAG: hypothetical protein ACLP6W_11600, partial [Bryobacteraceae bacterium]